MATTKTRHTDRSERSTKGPAYLIPWERIDRFADVKIGDFFIAPPDLRWASSSGYGIELDIADERWHAGHVNAIVANGPVAVVGADTGGVWLVNPAYDEVPQTHNFPAQPLSWDWTNTNVMSMAAGPDGPETIFVGCNTAGGMDTTLYLVQLRNVLGGMELAQTMPLPAPWNAVVMGLVTLSDPDRLVLATNQGVYWTAIPNPVSNLNGYAFTRATSFPAGASGIALGPDGAVIVAAYGSGTPGDPASGFFVGKWDTNGLTFNTATISGQPMGMKRTSVASCASNPSIAYGIAAAADDDNLGSIYRTNDGGATWAPCSLPTDPGNQGWYNNCIAVHVDDPDTVVVGWRNGAFFSTDKGQAWENRSKDSPHMHGDVHGLTFERTPDGVSLFAGTDGGVCLTNDLGKTWDSRYSKHLRNLQFYGVESTFILGDNGTFDASKSVPGLVGGATQDNGNLWCLTGDPNTRASLRQFESGDGNTVAFIEADVLHRNNTLTFNGVEKGNHVRISRWNAGALTWQDEFGDIIPAGGYPDGLPYPQAVGSVRNPTHKKDGRLLLAVAGKDTAVFAYLEGGEVGDFVKIADIPSVPSLPRTIFSIASFDGSAILVGTSDGHIFEVETDTGTVTDQTVNLGGWAGNNITRLLWTGEDDRFGTVSNSVVIRFANGTWDLAPGVTGAGVTGLDYEREVTGGVLFACHDFGVQVSVDRGNSWVDANWGLPKRPHCKDIRIGLSGDGNAAVHLATYGWSTFIARLHPRKDDGDLGDLLGNVPIGVAKILFGIIQDGDGVEIIGNTLHRVPPRSPASNLAVAIAIAGLANQFDDNAVEFRNMAHNIALKLAKG